mgnify:CR=1 FL=1
MKKVHKKKASPATLHVITAKPNHSIISPKKFGHDMYLNRPFLGIVYPLSLFFLRLIRCESDQLLIIKPVINTIKPTINSGEKSQEFE